MLDIQGQEALTRTSYTVTLAGRLDSRTAREFEQFQEELVRTGRTYLVLEARSLQYVSSAGIASLLALVRRLEGRGAAAIVAPNQEVRLLLGFFGITEYLPIFDDETQARAYLAERASALGPELAFETSVAVPLPETALPTVSAEPVAPVASSAAAGRPTRISESARPVRTRPAAYGGAAGVSGELREAIREELRRIVREEFSDSSTGGSKQIQSARAQSVGEEPRVASTTVSTMEAQGRPKPAGVPLARAEVVQCEQCGGRFRVRNTGAHMCPHCRYHVRVAADGSVRF